MPRDLLQLVLIACALCAGLAARADAPDTFQADYGAWRRQREANLRKPDGWLALAGLYWLQAGDNVFGSDASCACRFPEKAPARIGTFRLADGHVMVAIQPGVDVRVDGRAVTSVSIDVKEEEGRTRLTLGSLTWYVIRRDDRVGIRLKDSQSPVRASFHAIPCYPADPRWRITARFEAYRPPQTRRVLTALGTTTSVTVPGRLHFELGGRACTLDAIEEEPGDPELFIVFWDPTARTDTYPAGRYLYAPRADAQGRVILDFNRAYNPPCNFTPYATCSYPPPQNRLPVAVEAGEKRYAH